MKVYEAIADALVEEGLDTMFAVSGYGNLDLVVDLVERLNVRLVAARHEQGAVAMADGYARVSGRPGFCSVTQGPGLTNTPTALTTAVRRRSPVVLFAGDAPRANRHDIQLMDQRAFVEAIGAAFFHVRTEKTVGEDIQLALRRVRLGSGPAVIDANVDVQGLEVESGYAYTPSTATIPRPQRPEPDPERIRDAARMLLESRRPIVLAGLGAVRSGAREEIAAVAERLSALLATSIQAKDLFKGNPSSIGVAGGFASDAAEQLLGEADCILAFGATLNVWTTKHGHLFPQARVIQVDLEAERTGTVVPPDVAILADARATAAALTNELDGAGKGDRAAWLDRGRTLMDAETVETASDLEDGLDPRAVIAALDRLLPKNRSVVLDGGHFLPFPSIGLEVPDPTAFVFSQDFGAVGLGLPLGVGAAVGAPDRHCVTVVGDGGFMMSFPELETAVRYEIPMTVVILNDNAYGGEVRQLSAKNKPLGSVLFDNPEFAEVARALGADGISVRSLDDLDAAANVDGRKKPLVLDVKISREVTHKFVEEFTTKAPWED